MKDKLMKPHLSYNHNCTCSYSTELGQKPMSSECQVQDYLMLGSYQSQITIFVVPIVHLTLKGIVALT